MLIVDTGVLLAATDEADSDHAACTKLVEDDPGPLVTTPLVIAETAYLIGPTAEASFFRSLADSEITVEELGAADLIRIATLVETYVDLPLGGTDASVVALP